MSADPTAQRERQITVIRREAIDAGLRVYSKMESDDPDESPLEVALRVAVDTAIAALTAHAAGETS